MTDPQEVLLSLQMIWGAEVGLVDVFEAWVAALKSSLEVCIFVACSLHSLVWFCDTSAVAGTRLWPREPVVVGLSKPHGR